MPSRNTRAARVRSFGAEHLASRSPASCGNASSDTHWRWLGSTRNNSKMGPKVLLLVNEAADGYGIGHSIVGTTANWMRFLMHHRRSVRFAACVPKRLRKIAAAARRSPVDSHLSKAVAGTGAHSSPRPTRPPSMQASRGRLAGLTSTRAPCIRRATGPGRTRCGSTSLRGEPSPAARAPSSRRLQAHSPSPPPRRRECRWCSAARKPSCTIPCRPRHPSRCRPRPLPPDEG